MSDGAAKNPLVITNILSYIFLFIEKSKEQI